MAENTHVSLSLLELFEIFATKAKRIPDIGVSSCIESVCSPWVLPQALLVDSWMVSNPTTAPCTNDQHLLILPLSSSLLLLLLVPSAVVLICCLSSGSSTAWGTVDHKLAQKVSFAPAEIHTCSSNWTT